MFTKIVSNRITYHLSDIILLLFLAACASQREFTPATLALYKHEQGLMVQEAYLEILLPKILLVDIVPSQPTVIENGDYASITTWSPTSFVGITSLENIDGDSVRSFDKESEPNTQYLKFSILPGKHKIGIMSEGTILGQKESRSFKKSGDIVFSGGVSNSIGNQFVFSQSFREPLFLEFEAVAKKTYRIKTEFGFNTCKLSIEDNGILVTGKIVTDLNLSGDKELLEAKRNLK